MSAERSDGSSGGLADVLAALAAEGSRIAARYPGDAGARQPVHTVYGGAHLFRADSARRLGQLALAALAEYAADAPALAEALGMAPELAKRVWPRVDEKLRREAVEDFRIDFEDGYGNRPDEEEDGHAASAAREVAKGLAEGTLPPFIGIRIKPFSAELAARSVRTLELFLTTLCGETGGRLPANFVVTIPKVMTPLQVAALAELFARFEPRLGLRTGDLRLEIMVETTQSILDEEGRANVRRLADAAGGRCVAAHFGTYDYTASCDITAAHQHMAHPVCDFAKHVMQVALGGSGIWLSDGATNVLPVAPHRGATLSAAERAANRRVVHAAWRLHSSHVRHSLETGFYQGWDLHPAQLPSRYATLYGFFLEGIEAASERLSNFVGKAAQATLVGDLFDDAATGQGLLNYFLRAMSCGALTEEEAVRRSGLSLDELRGRSFVAILRGRRA